MLCDRHFQRLYPSGFSANRSTPRASSSIGGMTSGSAVGEAAETACLDDAAVVRAAATARARRRETPGEGEGVAGGVLPLQRRGPKEFVAPAGLKAAQELLWCLRQAF